MILLHSSRHAVMLSLAAFGVLLSGTAVRAADHLDSPSVQADGRLDINDVYAFQSPSNANNTVLVMTTNPFVGVMSPDSLNPRGTYDIMIDNNGDSLPDITFTLYFSRERGGSQRFLLLKNGRVAANGSTGPQAAQIAGGGQVRVDLFEDPFFFDLAGFNNGFAFTGTDAFAGANIVAMVIEVPANSLTAGSNMIGVFTRTTTGGAQFDRMGRPAINTALIPSGAKNAFNASVPANDTANFAATVNATIAALSNQSNADALTPILLPDILTFDVSSAAGFLNGRRLADDVIDAELTLLSDGAVTTDMVDSNDAMFLNTFPYLAPPNAP